MQNNLVDVATRFVDLTLKYNDKWTEGLKKLQPDEVQILFDLVSAAGFNPKRVTLGKLRGRYRDQDGDTGETYPINGLCPYKVVGRGEEESYDHYFATGWLDDALQFALVKANEGKTGRDKLVAAVAEEIERSIPLVPVQLTPEGDSLREYPPSPGAFGYGHFVEHTDDGDKLGACVGVHACCDGWMDRNRATKTHDAIVCRRCHLRVLFPKEVKTYGELRSALAARFTQAA